MPRRHRKCSSAQWYRTPNVSRRGSSWTGVIQTRLRVCMDIHEAYSGSGFTFKCGNGQVRTSGAKLSQPQSRCSRHDSFAYTVLFSSRVHCFSSPSLQTLDVIYTLFSSAPFALWPVVSSASCPRLFTVASPPSRLHHNFFTNGIIVPPLLKAILANHVPRCRCIWWVFVSSFMCKLFGFKFTNRPLQISPLVSTRSILKDSQSR